MAEKIIMPQLGESIAEGTIVKWLKSPGEKVAKDENVLLISTDKVEAEIPSPIDGVLLSTSVGPGETVPVGTVLGMVGQAGEAGQTATKDTKGEDAKPEGAKPAQKEEAEVQQTKGSESSPPASEVPGTAQADGEKPAATKAEAVQPASTSTSTTASTKDEQAPAASSGSRFLSPLVRKIAQENQVSNDELDQLKGSGREGRVTKDDVLSYLQTRGTKAPPSKAPAPTQAAPAQAPSVVIPPGEREVFKPVSTMRRVIMENMVASKRTSAHVTTFFEIDYTAVDRVREAHKDRFKEEEGVALTYTTFLCAAVCDTLKRHPYINAEIQGDKIRFKKDVHLGIAVALTEPEPGLMVPVIRNADQMNLRGLAHAVTDLAARVRTKRIKPDELSGGSFTITNPGNYGAIIGTPVINQPQVAILGVGQIKKQAVVMEVGGTDVIAIRRMGWLALSFDHRLIDGATADIFMADLKKTIENWKTTP